MMKKFNSKNLPALYEHTALEVDEANREKNLRCSKFDRQNLSREDQQARTDSIAREIHLRIGSIKKNIFEVGKLLVDAKKILGKGKFSDWVKNEVGVCQKTAINYMNIYKQCMGVPYLVEYFKPSVLYEICSPSFPEPLREELLNNAHGVHDYSRKEFLTVVAKFRKGEIDIKSDEVQNLLCKQKNQEFNDRYKAELYATKKDIEKRFETIKKLNNLSSDSYLLLKKKNDDFKKIYDSIEEMFENLVSSVDGKILILEQPV